MTATDSEGYSCILLASQWFIVDRYNVPVEIEAAHAIYQSARARAEELNADVHRRRFTT